ncbi:MAG: hypothetical protein Q8S04_07695, partial [Bacteroidales bacterium]|nr:hypothetical protein [Bacteroidales bacterium]
MKKLIFKLKQHTPIVHFQPDLKNSTLRASEVKPALDRFIIERSGGLKKLKERSPDWFVKNSDSSALNYKMRISQTTEKGVIKNNPNYFGDKSKNLVFGEGDAECILHIHSDSLAFVITKDLLMEFFLINNFGCRKTKGSGSYTLSSYYMQGESNESINENENLVFIKKISYCYKDVILNEYLSFTLKDDDNNDINKKIVFGVINYYWKRLKSGINYTDDNESTKSLQGEYKPSFLRDYIKNYRWEKRWLKEEFMKLKKTAGSLDEKFARAMLGLPSKFSFLDKGRLKKYSPTENKIALNYSFDVTVKAPEGIDRIPAPITFKPIITGYQCYIFLLIDKSYDSWDIKDKLFELKFKNPKFPLHIGSKDRNGAFIPTYIGLNKRDQIKNNIDKHLKF